MKGVISSLCVAGMIGMFISGCVGTKVRTAPDQGDPVAQFPKICKGDKWVWIGWSQAQGTDTWTAIVDKVNTDGSFEVIETAESGYDKDRQTYDKDWSLIKSFDLLKNKENDVSTPPRKLYSFPMFVGKRWNSRYESTSINSNVLQYSDVYTVTDYTDITVKAGTFDTFRIWRSHQAGTGVGTVHREIVYYSPEVKAGVKFEPSWRQGYELIDYSVSTCD